MHTGIVASRSLQLKWPNLAIHSNWPFAPLQPKCSKKSEYTALSKALTDIKNRILMATILKFCWSKLRKKNLIVYCKLTYKYKCSEFICQRMFLWLCWVSTDILLMHDTLIRYLIAGHDSLIWGFVSCSMTFLAIVLFDFGLLNPGLESIRDKK